MESKLDMVKDLSVLFRKYGSDKDINGYTPLYQTLFDHLQDREIFLLEVGIGTMIPGVPSSMVGFSMEGYRPGGSLRAWRDFFSKGIIIGMDIQKDTQFIEERIGTHLCDSTKKVEVDELFEGSLNQMEFDIIIDDGSHCDQHQFLTLANLYPHLKSGGIYVIEDINIGSEISGNPSRVAEIVGNNPFFYSGTKLNQMVVYKKDLQYGPQRTNY